VLGDLAVLHDDRVLVDYRTSDDAGVYKLDETRALVQTVDFFTPIVDDPFVYGQIAAANALSDVYAMGGRPMTALAIAAFPKDGDAAVLKQIFAGGLATLREAGVALLGGHTVQDAEIKFGYAVTGEVHPRRVLTNGGARVGDDLVLTKALGTGIIATALKFNRAPQAAIDAAVRSMTMLNRAAAGVVESLPEGTVHGCTDITGFGLIGHASEMAAASGCTVEIDAEAVPVLEGARALVSGNIPGGGRTNRDHFGRTASIDSSIDGSLADLFFDPQTSGGLLVALEPAQTGRARHALGATGTAACRVGRVLAPGPARVRVR
jgi:selenide,water dikinase